MEYILYLLLFIVVLFFFALLLLMTVDRNSKKNHNIKYGKCKKYLDWNWQSFESRHGLLNDEHIRKKLFPLVKELSPVLYKNQCVYDVGGNVGEITKMFNEYYPNNIIYTIEPLNSNFQELKMKFNRSKNVKLHNIGFGSFNGKKSSHTFGNGNKGDYIYPKRVMAEYEIKYMTVDSFYKKYYIFHIYIF